MKESVRSVYECDHCKKKYFRKYAAIEHEKYCWSNPKNHYACFDCVFLEKDRQTSDDGFSERTFRCSKRETYMHSIKAEKIKHVCLGYTELMPLVCEHRKDHVDTYFDNQDF